MIYFRLIIKYIEYYNILLKIFTIFLFINYKVYPSTKIIYIIKYLIFITNVSPNQWLIQSFNDDVELCRIHHLRILYYLIFLQYTYIERVIFDLIILKNKCNFKYT